MNEHAVYRVLTVAGSDSGGGAGIQADLKTFTATGVYGMAALTSVTAQNTVGVAEIHDLPPVFVARQIDVVCEDIGVDAAKTGMLSTAPIVEAVADRVRHHEITKLVVDPVMVAKSGEPLLLESARETLIKKLLPLAFVVTPNVPEAEALTGMTVRNPEDMKEAAARISGLGPKHVLVKGGHLKGPEAMDYLYDGATCHRLSAPWIDTENTHGTGCTYSAALAAYLAKGLEVTDAAQRSKDYLTEAIRRSLPLGQGHGPLNHFWPFES